MKDIELDNLLVSIFNLQRSIKLDFVQKEHRTKFNHALCMIKKELTKNAEALNEVKKNDAEYQKYDVERIELIKRFCTKDTNGEPALKNQQYQGLENNKEFNKEIKELREKYKDNLHEEIDLNIASVYKIKEAYLPISENFAGLYTEILFDFIAWEE